jgi:serine/threonine-protein kinase
MPRTREDLPAEDWDDQGGLVAASRPLAGRYLIHNMLGQGVLATTYRAIDQDSGREVAVKLFTDEASNHTEFRQQVLHLASRLAAFEHPNIAAVLDVGIEDGQLYLVAEFVEGHSLRALLRAEHRLGVERAVSIGVQAADGLTAAHQRGVIHGDLTPENVLIDQAGRVKLVDFGLVTLGVRLGLLPVHGLAQRAAYLSPEQVMGSAPGRRSDIYALAVVLYEALVGAPPFGGGNFLALASQRLVREPESLHRLVRDIPLAVDSAIARALAPNPSERYQSAAEFRTALLEREVALQVAEPLDSLTFTDRRPRPARRRPTLEALAVATPVLGTLGIGLVAFLVYTLFLADGFSFLHYARVPDLSGRTLTEAVQLARTAGLDVTVDQIQGTDDQPRDMVVAQVPPAGERALRATPVKLVVSGGIRTPDLRNMTLNNARAFLLRNSWKLGPVQTQAAPGVAPGTVVGQRPAPGEVVPNKTEVTIIVSGGNVGERTQVSASSGQDPGAATDGNEQTAWNPAGPAPQWIELDVRSPITLSSLELVPSQPREEPTIHEIWATTLSGDFLPVYTYRGTTADGQKMLVRLDQPVDDVVRVRVVTVMTGGGVGWREIRLLSDAASDASPEGEQPGAASGEQPTFVVVANTGGSGVYVRRTAEGGERVRAWPDTTRFQLRGEERDVNGQKWVAVTDPAGNQGWVPAQYVRIAGN